MTERNSNYGWVIVAICCAFQWIVYGTYGTYSFFVRPWQGEFGSPLEQIVLPLAIGHIGMMLGSMAAGSLLDRLPINRIVAAGLAINAAGFLAVSYARSMPEVMVAFSIALIGGGALSGQLTAQTLVTKWFTAKRGLALGVVTVGLNLAGLVGVTIVAAVLPDHGWRVTFQVLAALAAIQVPIALLFIRNPPPAVGEVVSVDAALGGHAGQTGGAGSILRTAAFWQIGLAILFPVVGIATLVALLEPITHDAGLSLAEARTLMQLLAVCGITSLVAGRLCDRLNFRVILIAMLTLNSAGLLMMAYASTYATLIAGVFLMGIGQAINLPLFASVTARAFGPARFGQAMGLLMFFFLAGAAAGPAAALVKEATGTYAAWFVFMAAGVVVCGLPMMLLRLDRSPAPAPA